MITEILTENGVVHSKDMITMPDKGACAVLVGNNVSLNFYRISGFNLFFFSSVVDGERARKMFHKDQYDDYGAPKIRN